MQVKRQDFEAWKALVAAEELHEPSFFDRETQVGFRLPKSNVICVLDYKRDWNDPAVAPLQEWNAWNVVTFKVTTGLHFRCQALVKSQAEKEALDLINLML